MTDLEAALEPVREILARRDAARRNGTPEAAPAAAPPAPVNGTASRSSIDWQLFDQNLAEVRKVVERLRNGAH